jgi:hypothetical protein
MARDNFSSKIKAALHQRVAHRCSNPDCRVSTIGPGQGIHAVANIGKAAHITAAAPGGERYDITMTSAQRCAINNGIWLCSDCATEVDVNKGTYSTELLLNWKRLAEQTAAAEKGKRQPRAEDARTELVAALTGATSKFTRTAIGNAHGAVEEVLNALDPRLRVSTSFTNKTTIYKLQVLENVGFKINIPAPLVKEWAAGMQRLVDHGHDAKLPATGVAVTGSPLLEQLSANVEWQSARISVESQKKIAIQKLTLVNPSTHESNHFDDIRGQVTLGQKSMSFDGSACADTLHMSFTISIAEPTDLPMFNVSLDLQGWHDVDVRRLPHFEKLRNLIERLRTGWRMEIVLEVDGEPLVRCAATLPPNSETLKSLGGHLAYVSVLRDIAPHLAVAIKFAHRHPITSEEFFDALEVVETIKGRTYGKADMATAPETRVISQGSNIDEILQIPSQEFSMLWIEQGGEFNAFGQAIPLPARETRIEGFQPRLADSEFDVTRVADGDGVLIRLEPTDDFFCSVRFLQPLEEPENFPKSATKFDEVASKTDQNSKPI